MEDFDSYRKYAEYEPFRIGNETLNYTLRNGKYSGDAGDSLQNQNGMQFSTYDHDNDMYEKNCAEKYDGAWWYNKCHLSNLNGKYLSGPHMTYANGINWNSWKGYYYSLKSTTMMIQRQNT